MKKITLLAATLVAITFASCKKDRVCTCTTTPTSGTAVTTKTTYFESRKKDARLYCMGSQTDVTAPVANTGDKTTCELK
ncbi:MAG: hypothetical protein K9H41_07345 [Bacteroidia bacterium]|nr:hypothetical protein [Bacteroidia bacterium]